MGWKAVALNIHVQTAPPDHPVSKEETKLLTVYLYTTPMELQRGLSWGFSGTINYSKKHLKEGERSRF